MHGVLVSLVTACSWLPHLLADGWNLLLKVAAFVQFALNAGVGTSYPNHTIHGFITPLWSPVGFFLTLCVGPICRVQEQ